MTVNIRAKCPYCQGYHTDVCDWNEFHKCFIGQCFDCGKEFRVDISVTTDFMSRKEREQCVDNWDYYLGKNPNENDCISFEELEEEGVYY